MQAARPDLLDFVGSLSAAGYPSRGAGGGLELDARCRSDCRINFWIPLVRDLRPQDVRQPGRLDRGLVAGGDHASVGDDGDVGEPVRGLERLDGLHHQRKTRRVHSAGSSPKR